ncbi:MAG: glycosyltransferase, partial [Deltaproteobacteria bacterium]|nr:glycosyltransferase [Deltaproteobacteria bacterium]
PGAEPAGVPVIVLCARMLWNKEVGDLVAASRLLKKSGARFRIILAGDTDPGNPDSIPKERLLAWESQGLVKWTGHTDEMWKVFAGSSIVVLPSSYGEGVPRSLIEAAASGRPIVAYDVPGCREVVRHNRNGLLVPSGNTEALADALKKLLDDPAARRRMGAYGRELAVNEFSLEKVVTETMQVYENLLS